MSWPLERYRDMAPSPNQTKRNMPPQCHIVKLFYLFQAPLWGVGRTATQPHVRGILMIGTGQPPQRTQPCTATLPTALEAHRAAVISTPPVTSS